MVIWQKAQKVTPIKLLQAVCPFLKIFFSFALSCLAFPYKLIYLGIYPMAFYTHIVIRITSQFCSAKPLTVLLGFHLRCSSEVSEAMPVRSCFTLWGGVSVIKAVSALGAPCQTSRQFSLFPVVCFSRMGQS